MTVEDTMPDLGTRAIRGATWMLSLRWVIRLIGLINTVILARLLTPEDFGIIAIAVTVSALTRILQVSGVLTAILRLPEIGRHHYDTAWTLQLCTGLFTALLLFAAAPLSVSWFNVPSTEPVLWCLASAAAFDALTSPGMIEYRRKLELRRYFMWLTYARLAGFVVTIAAAFILRSYWAIVIGMCVQTLVSVLLSYLLHPFRPKVSFSARREIYGFSFWSSIRAASVVLSQRLDRLVLAGTVTPAQLGQYNMGTELSEMINRELVAPIQPVVLSAIVNLQADVERLYRGILRSIGLNCLIAFPAGIGASLMAHDLIIAGMGSQWEPAASILQILALAALPFAVSSSFSVLLEVRGQIKLLTAIAWIEVGVIAAVTIFLAAQPVVSLEAIAWGILAARVASSVVISVLGIRPYPGLAWRVCAQVTRPMVAALFMAACLWGSFQAVDLNSFSSVLVRVPLGAIVFGGALLAIWALAGRPDGAEREVYDRILMQWRRVKNKRIGRKASS